MLHCGLSPHANLTAWGKQQNCLGKTTKALTNDDVKVLWRICAAINLISPSFSSHGSGKMESRVKLWNTVKQRNWYSEHCEVSTSWQCFKKLRVILCSNQRCDITEIIPAWGDDYTSMKWHLPGFVSNDFSEPSACDHHSCEWNLVFMIVSFRTILVNLVLVTIIHVNGT